MKDKKKIVAAVIYGIISNNASGSAERARRPANIPDYLNELKYHETPNGNVEFETVETDINLEIYDKKNNISKRKTIGKKIKEVPSYKGIRIVGGPEVRKYKVEMTDGSGEHSSGKRFGVSPDNEQVKIDTPTNIVIKFKKKYQSRGKDIRLSENDLKLVYYKPEGLNRLIPMYQIGNKKNGPMIKQKMKDDKEKDIVKGHETYLLGMYFPANEKYQNTFTVNDLIIKKGIQNTTDSSTNDEEVKETTRSWKYIITFTSENNLNLDRLNILGNFKVNNKEYSDNKYTFHCTGNLEREQKILVDYLNEYDVSTTKLIQKTRPSITTPDINPITPIINPITPIINPITPIINPITPIINPNRIRPRGDNNDWGIEWGESSIGGSCYSNYVNYMDDHTSSINEYKWTKPNAWVRDFWDKDKPSGLDHKYVDDVDTSTIIAHGNGWGFNFEGDGPNNGNVIYWDANDANTWGNRDLEFQAWLSCKVLKKEWSYTNSAGDTVTKQWWERWGSTFNGLHLICGFQTNAYVATHKHLKYFAKNMYKHGKKVRKSWFDAADDDQPDGVEAVVMGPVIRNDLEGDFNSYNFDGYRLAYYNDHMWSTGDGAGKDLTKKADASGGESTDVIAWWRVVHTV